MTQYDIKTIHDYSREYNKIIRDAMAQAWREGYLQGAEDERTASEVDFREFGVQIGPSRANPYEVKA